MFDKVTRAELSAEVERRIRAESEARFLRAENTRLLTALEDERIRHTEQIQLVNEAHAQQVTTILDHVAPLAEKLGGFGDLHAHVEKSPVELLADALSEPAIGPGQIEAKRNKIAFLEKLVNQNKGRVSSEPRGDDAELNASEEERIAEKVAANG